MLVKSKVAVVGVDGELRESKEKNPEDETA